MFDLSFNSISTLSIQDQLSRWDPEKSHTPRDGQKQFIEDEEEEFPTVSVVCLKICT